MPLDPRLAREARFATLTGLSGAWVDRMDAYNPHSVAVLPLVPGATLD